MNPTIPFPRPEHGSLETIAGKWPVVARLPDVSDDAPSRSQSTRKSANTAHDYRFDPPQARSLRHTHDGDHAPRANRRQSPILPRSDPFAIRGASMMERLGPVVRFVLLVALFTAAGVILLAGGKNAQPSAREKSSAEATVTRQKLEPAAMVVDASTSAATAAGPTTIADSLVDRDSADSPDTDELNAPTNKPTPDDAQVQRGASEDAMSPYPETGWPQAAFPEGGHSALPQVQTTDAPGAIAHLPGFITEIPPRHASHDDNQPGLH